MSWAVDLAAFCDIYGAENHTNGNHLAVLSVNVAFVYHFVAPTTLSPTSIGLLVILVNWLHQ